MSSHDALHIEDVFQALAFENVGGRKMTRRRRSARILSQGASSCMNWLCCPRIRSPPDCAGPMSRVADMSTWSFRVRPPRAYTCAPVTEQVRKPRRATAAQPLPLDAVGEDRRCPVVGNSPRPQTDSAQAGLASRLTSRTFVARGAPALSQVMCSRHPVPRAARRASARAALHGFGSMVLGAAYPALYTTPGRLGSASVDGERVLRAVGS